MCFQTTEFAKKKTAKTDIECWKILKKGKGYKSNFKNFLYKKGVINPLVKLYKTNWYEINQGYHSYRSEKKAREVYIPRIHKICKFIIPASSHYYANVDSEYVSDQIMLIDEVKK